MPRSDDYAAGYSEGYRAGVEAAAERCRACAEDMREIADPKAGWPRFSKRFVAAAVTAVYDDAAREVEKLLEEPTT